MRKAAILVSILFATGLVAGADAVISPGSPEDIVLDSSNSFEVTKEFDGSASTPESATYTWSWVENSTSKTGETVDFTFTRQNSKSNTIRLTVTSETDSSNDSVTQTLRDKPEIKSVSPSSSKSLDLNDTNEDGKVDYTVAASNTFDGPVSYEWEDGSGNVVSSQANFTYDFNSTGDYTFTVNVSDSENYFQTKQAAQVSISNSSSSTDNNNNKNNQNGGAGGGSTAVFEEGYIFGDVQDGDVEEASFSESPVTKVTVGFSDGEDSTEIESDAEENMDDLPGGGVDSEPDESVYRFVELNTVNFSDSDVDNMTFEFEVEKSWVEENDIMEDSIDLLMYDSGEWESTGAEKVDEDSDKLYYESQVSGTPSVLAITGEKKSPDFRVSEISLEPETPELNQTVNITVEVENDGTATGDYTVSLDIGDETKEEEITDLGPGESTTVDFSHVFRENGSYQVEAGESSVEVQLGDTGSATATNKGQDGGLPWLMALVGLVVVGGAALSVGFLYMDEGRREEILQSVGAANLDQVKEKIPDAIYEEEDEEEFEWEGFA